MENLTRYQLLLNLLKREVLVATLIPVLEVMWEPLLKKLDLSFHIPKILESKVLLLSHLIPISSALDPRELLFFYLTIGD